MTLFCFRGKMSDIKDLVYVFNVLVQYFTVPAKHSVADISCIYLAFTTNLQDGRLCHVNCILHIFWWSFQGCYLICIITVVNLPQKQ